MKHQVRVFDFDENFTSGAWKLFFVANQDTWQNSGHVTKSVADVLALRNVYIT